MKKKWKKEKKDTGLLRPEIQGVSQSPLQPAESQYDISRSSSIRINLSMTPTVESASSSTVASAGISGITDKYNKNVINELKINFTI